MDSLDSNADALSSSPTLPPAPGVPRIERRLTPLPSLNAQSDARVQAAIAASARAEASLSSLFRAIQSLDTGLGGAREANELLTRELEALREMVGAANEQQLGAKQKATLLEQALDRARKDAEREKQFLTEQHDAFIVDLMDEQEGELERRDAELHTLREELANLRARQAELEKQERVSSRDLPTMPPPNFDARSSSRMRVAERMDEGTALDRAERIELERTAHKLAEDRERARETVQRLQAQRDDAQSTVTRVTKERDDALAQIFRLKAELGGPRIPLSTRPPQQDSRKPEAPAHSSKPPKGIDLTLDSIEIDPQLGLVQVRTPQLEVPALPSIQQKPTAPAPPITSVMSPPSSKPSDVGAAPRSNPLAAPKAPRVSALAAPLSTSQPPNASPPPDELRSALTSSPALQPLGASSRPPLKQKPDVSTRPLVGYSLNDEHVEPEQIEGVRLSKPPPIKR